MNSFETYRVMDDSLSIEDFLSIHQRMIDSIGNDEDALELFNELMESAISYTDIRARWTMMTREEKMDIDESRTMKHDSLIIKFNKLARFLDMSGRDISWRNDLGYTEDDPMKRKRIGDFACYLVFIAGVNAR